MKKANKRIKHLKYKKIILLIMIAMVSVSICIVMRQFQKDAPYVATVNGEPISLKEFNLRLMANRIHKDDMSVYEFKEKALDECIKIKVQQILARQKGILHDISYASFLKEFYKENKRRREIVKNKGVIFGPVQYQENLYFDDVFAKMVLKLKENLEGNEILFTEKELYDYYEVEKDNDYKKEDSIKILKISIPCIGKDGNVMNVEKKKALIKIKQIKDRIDKGVKFEEAVKEFQAGNSVVINVGEQVMDESTARYDRMVNNKLRQETLKLSTNEVSDVFEANNTFYIIRCLERHDGGYLPFEEVRDIVKSMFVDEKYNELIDKMTNDATVVLNKEVYMSIKVTLSEEEVL